MTRLRTEVTRALDAADGFQSAQALHDTMRHAGVSVGLTTVYRHLQALADAGEVDVLRTDDGEAVYRRCVAESHHHHLVCRSCGTTVEVTGPAVETWAEQVARKHGFRDVTHTAEVFGTCRTCRT
jgi:Fur family ferric uptake transcriptional regulator